MVLTPLTLVTIADTDNDAHSLLAGSDGIPLNGRHAVATALETALISSGQVEDWFLLTRDGWHDVQRNKSIDLRADALHHVENGILFDPFRHYRDRLAVFRAGHHLPWPIVTMAHSIGYGPWFARGQSDIMWPPQPGDRVVFPSEASRIAWSGIFSTLAAAAGLDARQPVQRVIPYSLQAVKTSARITSCQPSKVPRFFTLGRIDAREKFDYDAYAQALGQLARELPAAQLPEVVIAGQERSAEDSESVRAIFSQHCPAVSVTVSPDITESAKSDLYSSATALIHPANSHAESFGLVLDEAAAIGLPIVCTKFSGQPEALAGYGNVHYVTGHWSGHSDDTDDMLMQFGLMPGGAAEVHSLLDGLRWALAAERIRPSRDRRSIRNLVDDLLQLMIEALEASRRGTSVSDRHPSPVPEAFAAYWID
ncbi:glycosyltransferase [Kribbella sp. GL6]|uniref:glycosyltransferase n=1 Tax=Kribbella sp. GL6 TaxID=3419765 RepID=UPI003CFF379C